MWINVETQFSKIMSIELHYKQRRYMIKDMKIMCSA